MVSRRSQSSVHLARTHLHAGFQPRHLSETEREKLERLYEEIAKMLTGLIAHLESEDRNIVGEIAAD